MVAPALREVPTPDAVAVSELIDRLERGTLHVVVFMTGVGAATLFGEARRLGRLEALVDALGRTVNVARGQKPWRPLREVGVPVSVTVPTPYTTVEVLQTLATLSLRGRGVALLHYGERSSVLANALLAAGADLFELLLYEWRLPEDTGPMERLIDAAIAGDLDAVAFTSKVQVRHLLEVAQRKDREPELVAALNSRTVVAAVGPTCAEELESAGIRVRVMPINPKMGPMVIALAEHLRRG